MTEPYGMGVGDGISWNPSYGRKFRIDFRFKGGRIFALVVLCRVELTVDAMLFRIRKLQPDIKNLQCFPFKLALYL